MRSARGFEGIRSHMRSALLNTPGKKTAGASLIVILFLAVAGFTRAVQEPAKTSAENAPSDRRGFVTPEAALAALIHATAEFNLQELKQILGPESEDLVSSEDPVQDKNRAATFAEKARQKNRITIDPKNPTHATISVGTDYWPLPIPLRKIAGHWYFDTKAGRQEILFRRIGANELDAIQICRGYAEAQEEYAEEKHDGAEVNQYAQRIISTPGKHDGLAWQNPDGSWGGPVGEGAAQALQQGYSNRSQPFHGYYFKILKGQGPSAPLGAMDFLVNGAMIGGFALAAAPADYQVTGVKTFIVGYQGIVYEKDLGPDTLAAFRTMELYDPDKTWHRTNDNW
jgi:hypothetical protein